MAAGATHINAIWPFLRSDDLGRGKSLSFPHPAGGTFLGGNPPGVNYESNDRKKYKPEYTIMGATQQNCKRGRRSRFRRKPQSSNKCTEALKSDITDGNEAARSAEGEEIDSLLLSALRFWEVERDLIEERIAATEQCDGQ